MPPITNPSDATYAGHQAKGLPDALCERLAKYRKCASFS